MKIKNYMFVIITIVLIVTGCSQRMTDETNLLNLDQVEDALSIEGIKLNPKGVTNDWKIGNVVANRYVVLNNTENDQIFIYIFNSQKARLEGRKEFDKLKKEKENGVVRHSVYEIKNGLVIYLLNPNSSTSTLSLTIERALQDL